MVRRTLWLIGILWVAAVVIVAGLFYTGRFTQYLDTVSKPGTSATGTLRIASSAFNDGESIPSLYTCDAKQISPPFTISGVPVGTKSFVLIMEDRDVPKSLKPDGVFLHWLVFDIDPTKTDIGVGEVPGTLGLAGSGAPGYVGPCPPKDMEPSEHRYYFDLYALDTMLRLKEGTEAGNVRAAMEGHVVDHATLVGRYQKQN